MHLVTVPMEQQFKCVSIDKAGRGWHKIQMIKACSVHLKLSWSSFWNKIWAARHGDGPESVDRSRVESVRSPERKNQALTLLAQAAVFTAVPQRPHGSHHLNVHRLSERVETNTQRICLIGRLPAGVVSINV